MRKIILCLFALLAIIFNNNFAFSISYPSPAGYVNDFAEIIPDDIEGRIEARLSEYERQTSIEIAVVTTKSLDGLPIEDWANGIFNQWGVGKKSKDNGIVFAIAPNERETRIEVGYGLEGDMNDANAGTLLDENAMPYFMEGEYATGIEKTTEAIIKTLGGMSLQERNEARLQRLKEQQERAEREAEARRIAEAREKEMARNFMASFFVIAVAGVIFFLIFCIAMAAAKAIRERKRKDALRRTIMYAVSKIRDEENPSLKKELKDAKDKARSFPPWAFILAERMLRDADSAIEEIGTSLGRIENENEKNPDRANELLSAAMYGIKKASSCITAAAVKVPKKIEEYQKEASACINQARRNISDAREGLAKAKEEGLFDEDVILARSKELDESEALLKSSESSLSPEEAPVICTSVEEISWKVQATASRIEAVMLAKSNAESLLKALPEYANNIENAIPIHEKVLDEIKRTYPRENWEGISNNLLLAAGLIASSRQLISAAKEHSSARQKRFFDAKAKAEEAQESLDKAMSMLAGINERKQEIEQAKQGYAAKLADAELKVLAASEKVKDSDVGAGAKSKANEAEAKLKEAKGFVEQGGMIDWLSAITMITTAIALAGEAELKAKGDIDDAEIKRDAERKMRIEEEERGKERKAAAAAAHYSSRSRPSSPPSYKSNTGSRPISFGGGRAGGGGASRKW